MLIMGPSKSTSHCILYSVTSEYFSWVCQGGKEYGDVVQVTQVSESSCTIDDERDGKSDGCRTEIKALKHDL